MVGEEFEVTTPLLENILNQANALQAIGNYQFGPGRKAFEEAASLLSSRKRIVLSGMGASFFACIPFQYQLAEQGLEAIAVETAELLYFKPTAIDKDTVVVLVSRSGESVEVTKLLPVLRESGASILGILNVPESTLCFQADRAIVMHCPPDQLVAIQTYVGTLAVFALLHAALMNKLEQAKLDVERTVRLLKKLLPEWVEASERWREFLNRETPLYLLGRGSTLGAVTEGVLLMHETAKAPSVGMSVAQFRHGPVEVVDADFHAIVIGTQPATTDFDAALAEDIIRMGGHVCWLGPALKNQRFESLCSWPADVPEGFTSIFETIPLQLAAYRKAELNGIRPGEFRWAPTITSSEAGFPAIQQ